MSLLLLLHVLSIAQSVKPKYLLKNSPFYLNVRIPLATNLTYRHEVDYFSCGKGVV